MDNVKAPFKAMKIFDGRKIVKKEDIFACKIAVAGRFEILFSLFVYLFVVFLADFRYIQPKYALTKASIRRIVL